jgi:hypothetical protein
VGSGRQPVIVTVNKLRKKSFGACVLSSYWRAGEEALGASLQEEVTGLGLQSP